MVASTLDELVREYLLFRGFWPTLKSLDQEIKADKEKSGRADKILDSLLALINAHDLNGLRDLWSHLQTRIFSRLESSEAQATAKLEAGLFKLYLVNCIQARHPEKVHEFFERLSPSLQGVSEWKDWFILPFLTNPEAHPVFGPFFTRQWQDTLVLSLFNLLALIYACLPPPRLADYHASLAKLNALQEENEELRSKVQGMGRSTRLIPEVQPPEDVMDDFFIIAPEATPADCSSSTLKSFLRNITGTNVGGTPTVASSVEKRSKAPAANLKVTPQARSVSKSRVQSGQTTTSHAPVKRLSQVSLTGSTSGLVVGSVPTPRKSPGPTSSEDGLTMTPVSPASADKMAYLLLGQEDYVEHHSEVTHCKFSSVGGLIASCDVDGVVKVWSPTPNPRTEATFIVQSLITALDWIPNSDRHFLYGTRQGVIRVCDQIERKTQSEVKFEDQRSVGVITCSPNSQFCGIATSLGSMGQDTLSVYDLKTMTSIQELSETTPISEVTGIHFNHNSQMMITSGKDGKIRIFDLRKNDCISSWLIHDRPILTASLSHDETKIFALTEDGMFSGWSLYQSGQTVFEHKLDDPYFHRTLPSQSVWNRRFALAGDGRHVLTCSMNGAIIHEFDQDHMTKVLGLKGLRADATCTDWSAIHDCGPCITASSDGQITISTLLSQ